MPREHRVQTQLEDRTALTKPWLVSHIPKRIHDYTQFASTLKKKKQNPANPSVKSLKKCVKSVVLETYCLKFSLK